jgi:hypothetical protein
MDAAPHSITSSGTGPPSPSASSAASMIKHRLDEAYDSIAEIGDMETRDGKRKAGCNKHCIHASA